MTEIKSQMINIQENIPLSRHTTFKIGGPARFFCEVKNEHELEEAIKYAKEQKIAAFIMGGGSNIVVNDKGFDGLVIKIVSSSNGNQPQVKMKMENGNIFIECWAGESLASLVKLASSGSLAGLEWAAGVPGTLGGAIRGNAGAYGGSIADVIESVRVLDLDDMRVTNYNLEKCQFKYRSSTFKENEYLVVLSAILRFGKGDKSELESKIKDTISKRSANYPKFPSAGSFFQNPVVSDLELRARFEKEANCQCKDEKIPAGWLITEVGLKGKKVGNIQVSEEHGNFLVNLGGGKAEEVVMLSSLIKQKVRDELGVQLSEEVKYVGF
jgi:UDP-N-acetylmuramate dehydrogenase